MTIHAANPATTMRAVTAGDIQTDPDIEV